LRYGDVCLLGGSDPYPIEVKSNPKLNQRGKRQAATLNRLTDFLETDHAIDFRAPGETKRIAFTAPERNHQNAMNTCIAAAERAGHCVVKPEPGLTYIATYGHLPQEALASLPTSGKQIMFMLNEDKRQGTWTIYEPFTRSIRDRQHLLDFVVGRLVLMVMFDIELMCEAMRRPGWDVSFHDDVPATIQLHHLASGARIGVSRQLIHRIGFEFISPSWLAESQIPNVDELATTLASPENMPPSSNIDSAFWISMFGKGS